jgi:hypothetical protein
MRESPSVGVPCLFGVSAGWRSDTDGIYGMECDKPLLQKLSVNATPFETMIFIPKSWILDHNRIRSGYPSGSLVRPIIGSDNE